MSKTNRDTVVKPVNILNRDNIFHNSHDAERCGRWIDLCLYEQYSSEYSILVMMWLALDWVTHPFINELPLILAYHTIYVKIFQIPVNIPFVWIHSPLPFVTGVGFKLCICFPPEIWISRSWRFHWYWI